MMVVYRHMESGRVYYFSHQQKVCTLCKHWESQGYGHGWCTLFKQYADADGTCLDNWEPRGDVLLTHGKLLPGKVSQ